MTIEKTLYFLHGFLGDPSDWDEVIQYLPGYRCIRLSYPFQLPQAGILVGYSMGGRIALSCSLPKILISAHLGLTTEKEKQARLQQDKEWMHMLETVPFHDFLTTWYQQPLFHSLQTHPLFPNILQRRLKNSSPRIAIEQLQKHSLATQTFHIPPNTALIYGAEDKKYHCHYAQLPLPSYPISGAGHACHLTEPKAVARTIQAIQIEGK